MKKTVEAGGPHRVGQARSYVFGPGSGLEGRRHCLMVSKSVCVLQRFYTEEQMGPGIPGGGLAWWKVCLKQKGEVKSQGF